MDGSKGPTIMNLRGENTNRRNLERFNVKDSIYAALRPNYIHIGQILDINKSGLAFQHLDGSEEPNNIVESSELLIFLNKGVVYIDKIPIKSILEIEFPDDLPYNSLKKKRICIQFGKLTFNQSVQLEYFILNHTNEVLRDRRNIIGQKFYSYGGRSPYQFINLKKTKRFQDGKRT